MDADNIDCFRCRSRRVVTGYFVNGSGFKCPVQLRFDLPKGFLRKLVCGASKYLSVQADSSFCLDCGLVWASVNPATAEHLVRNRESQELRQRLGLVETSAMADDADSRACAGDGERGGEPAGKDLAPLAATMVPAVPRGGRVKPNDASIGG